jgi:hypothetical protein
VEKSVDFSDKDMFKAADVEPIFLVAWIAVETRRVDPIARNRDRLIYIIQLHILLLRTL